MSKKGTHFKIGKTKKTKVVWVSIPKQRAKRRWNMKIRDFHVPADLKDLFKNQRKISLIKLDTSNHEKVMMEIRMDIEKSRILFGKTEDKQNQMETLTISKAMREALDEHIKIAHDNNPKELNK